MDSWTPYHACELSALSALSRTRTSRFGRRTSDVGRSRAAEMCRILFNARTPHAHRPSFVRRSATGGRVFFRPPARPRAICRLRKSRRSRTHGHNKSAMVRERSRRRSGVISCECAPHATLTLVQLCSWRRQSVSTTSDISFRRCDDAPSRIKQMPATHMTTTTTLDQCDIIDSARPAMAHRQQRPPLRCPTASDMWDTRDRTRHASSIVIDM